MTNNQVGSLEKLNKCKKGTHFALEIDIIGSIFHMT